MNEGEGTTPVQVPEYETVQVVSHLPGEGFDRHDDPIGLVLAMADKSLRSMVDDHGVDAGMVRIRVERATVDATEVPTVVLMIEGDRPFGWVRPADHVGEAGSEAP